MPLLLSGVMFGERHVPAGSGISIPPSPGWSRSGPVGPIPVWHVRQPPAFAMYAPRSTSFGSGPGGVSAFFAGAVTAFGAVASAASDGSAFGSSWSFLQPLLTTTAAHTTMIV